MTPSRLIRPLVRELHAYVPGEQPKIKGLVKLNTNENPYPPSPKVLAAVKGACDQRLRLYPNPTADALRAKLARLHGCAVENLIVGNGSDELLALATRAFVEPAEARCAQCGPPRAGQPCVWDAKTTARFVEQGLSARTVQYFNPSYSLYPVLADITGAVRNAVPLAAGFTLPGLADLRRGGQWDFRAALSFITTPNAPSGRGYCTAELEALCRAQKGVVVLDEAYVDFARENALALALSHPHVLVARTFSKAYSLCFQRVGYFIGHPALIGALHKIRDSYNVNGLGQVAAVATLDDLPYYRRNFRKVIATRERLGGELTALGFEVFPSQTNFVMAKPPRFPAQAWLEKWRARKILVRWWPHPEVKDFVRISIGTDAEIDALVRAAKRILAGR
ncbi:MAG: aminotransferase class I/II-fold pyridoxal phosphate-dependent enzyme [Verrucomicrobia bacterium]|nr:aminotransferase class I/II-fold pyridoxal phosphate-dependent enzyme [Verrucomicrobiota bacterium]